MFKSQCPLCKTDGQLTVISGTFTAFGMVLLKDGFAFCDAKNVHTEDELVECQACGKIFHLEELALD